MSTPARGELGLGGWGRRGMRRDDRSGAPAPKGDLLFNPAPVAPVEGSHKLWKKEGEGIAGAGAVEALEEGVVAASHGGHLSVYA